MWIASKFGFVSITVYPKNNVLYQVRARDRQHLESLMLAAGLQGVEIRETTHTDYRFRVLLDADGLASVNAALRDSIDYTNFKSACHNENPPINAAGEVQDLVRRNRYVDALHQVWGIFMRLQPKGKVSNESSKK